VNGTRLHFKRYLIDSLIRAILQSEALANLTQRKNMKPSFTDCLNVLSEPQGILYYNYLKSV
jgi:serine/threonine protein kinase HipA of HipAB toxin-antitoxin module